MIEGALSPRLRNLIQFVESSDYMSCHCLAAFYITKRPVNGITEQKVGKKLLALYPHLSSIGNGTFGYPVTVLIQMVGSDSMIDGLNGIFVIPSI